jgi:hypothetical protein
MLNYNKTSRVLSLTFVITDVHIVLLPLKTLASNTRVISRTVIKLTTAQSSLSHATYGKCFPLE